MDKPLTVINVKQWQGRVSNASPLKLQPGAGQIHENLRCQVPGQLDARPGMRSANVSAGGDAINVITYPYPAGTDWLIVHGDDGSVSALHPT